MLNLQDQLKFAVDPEKISNCDLKRLLLLQIQKGQDLRIDNVLNCKYYDAENKHSFNEVRNTEKEHFIVNDSIVNLLIEQFQIENEDLSVETALLVYNFICCGQFSFLNSNLHKFLITAITRLLSSQNATIKQIANYSIQQLLTKEEFFNNSFVKFNFDSLLIRTLTANFCDKNDLYMLESFKSIQMLILKCNIKHSERYLKLYDEFCKSFFLASLVLPSEKIKEFKLVLAVVGYEIIVDMNVSVVRHFDDFLILFDGCLCKETKDESFKMLLKLISCSWPVMKFLLSSVFSVLAHYLMLVSLPEKKKDNWIKPHIVSVLQILNHSCGKDVVFERFEKLISSLGDSFNFLMEWFPSNDD